MSNHDDHIFETAFEVIHGQLGSGSPLVPSYEEIAPLMARLEELENQNAVLRIQLGALAEVALSGDDVIAENVALRKAFGPDGVPPCGGCELQEETTWDGEVKVHSGERSNGGVATPCRRNKLDAIKTLLSQSAWAEVEGKMHCKFCNVVGLEGTVFDGHERHCQAAIVCGWRVKGEEGGKVVKMQSNAGPGYRTYSSPYGPFTTTTTYSAKRPTGGNTVWYEHGPATATSPMLLGDVLDNLIKPALNPTPKPTDSLFKAWSDRLRQSYLDKKKSRG